jgi:AraC family transcriptional regulator
VRPPGAHTFLSHDHCAAIMLSASPGMEGAFASDRMQAFDAPAGMLVISPAGVDSRAIWAAPRENVTIALTSASLQELAEHECDHGRVELQPLPFGTVDRTALQLGQRLQAELARGERANALYVDALITQFGIHLLRHYGGAKPRAAPAGGLSADRARKVEEYLRENYAQKLSVAELAAVCGLSAGHFALAFSRTFGQPPHQYLIHLRLAAAERLLAESDLRIADIAYRTGFASQSHLTETLRKYKRVSPAQIRRGR